MEFNQGIFLNGDVTWVQVVVPEVIKALAVWGLVSTFMLTTPKTASPRKRLVLSATTLILAIFFIFFIFIYFYLIFYKMLPNLRITPSGTASLGAAQSKSLAQEKMVLEREQPEST